MVVAMAADHRRDQHERQEPVKGRKHALSGRPEAGMATLPTAMAVIIIPIPMAITIVIFRLRLFNLATAMPVTSAGD